MSPLDRTSAPRDVRHRPSKPATWTSLTRFLYGYILFVFMYIITRGFFVSVRPYHLPEMIIKILSGTVVFVLLVLFFKAIRGEFGWRSQIPLGAFLAAVLTAISLEFLVFV